ncbi:MAG: hypothetical protein U9Q82_11990, partial [Chloroflexota bacterium]|nr:hypothetical protein [Chloroflexota bacterium]
MKTKFSAIFILMALFSLPACASGQPESTITLTPSRTPEPTGTPTNTLTPSPTPIPATPTFPAPEDAGLPDCAVRSENEQGQEVILDQPGGEVLWTLVEDQSGALTWQKALTEVQQALLSAAQAEFNALAAERPYEIKATLTEDGQVVGVTPFDAKGDPYCSYQDGEVVVNHVGRGEMEELIAGQAGNGRSAWMELLGYKWDETSEQYSQTPESEPAVWDSDFLAYRFPDSDAVHPDHPQFFQPLMSNSSTNIANIEEGRVNFCETFESEDYVPGESGLRIDFMIAANYPFVEWWASQPKEVVHRVYTQMYLDNFPNLKGRQITVRVISEDVTREGNLRGQVFDTENFATLVGKWTGGMIKDFAPGHNLVTLSLGDDIADSYRDDYDKNDEGIVIGTNKGLFRVFLRNFTSSIPNE